jgi:hypothetical protein
MTPAQHEPQFFYQIHGDVLTVDEVAGLMAAHRAVAPA